MSIQIVNDSSSADVDLEMLVSVASHALTTLRIHPESELSMALVTDEAMAALHLQWMDEAGPTDVMSFPMDELVAPPEGAAAVAGMLGDIVIAPEFARRQAAEAGNEFSAELRMLTVHGVLHLLGHDHAEAEEERVMFALQAELLDSWSGSAPRTQESSA